MGLICIPWKSESFKSGKRFISLLNIECNATLIYIVPSCMLLREKERTWKCLMCNTKFLGILKIAFEDSAWEILLGTGTSFKIVKAGSPCRLCQHFLPQRYTKSASSYIWLIWKVLFKKLHATRNICRAIKILPICLRNKWSTYVYNTHATGRHPCHRIF